MIVWMGHAGACRRGITRPPGFVEISGATIKSALRNDRKIPSFCLPACPLPDVLRLYSNEGLSLHSILDAPQLTFGQRIMYSAWLSNAVQRVSGALGVSLGEEGA